MNNKAITGFTLLTAALIMPLQGKAEGSNALWGLKANLGVELPGKWYGSGTKIEMYRHGFGFSLGGVCNIDLSHDFYFEPGVALFYEGYSYKGLILSNPDGSVAETDPGIYKIGLRVPLVFGYDIPLSDSASLSVFTGPQVSYSFAGEINVKHKELTEGFDTSLFGNNNQRRTDVAWKVGVGVPLQSWVLSLEADFGLTDLAKSDVKFRENRVTLAATYFF